MKKNSQFLPADNETTLTPMELNPFSLSGGVFTVLPNGSLQISKASVPDSGTYICVAQNPAGTALGKTKLRVQGKALMLS